MPKLSLTSDVTWLEVPYTPHAIGLSTNIEAVIATFVAANWTVHKPSHFYRIRVSRFLPCLGPPRCFLVHRRLSHCHSRFSLFGRIKSGAPLRRLLSTSMFSRKPKRAVRCSVILRSVLSRSAPPALVPGQLVFHHRRATLHSRVLSVAICAGWLGCFLLVVLSRANSIGAAW